MSNIIIGLYYILYGFSSLIFINIILSWFPSVYNYKIFRGLRRLTDTYMEPFHGMLVLGMLDFTPIVGIVVFDLILRAYIALI